MKALVAVILLVAAASAGCKEVPKPSEVQCRFMAVDPSTKDVHIGSWSDCKTTENTEEYIYENLDHPGLVIWTEERTLKNKKWSSPVEHTKPRTIPEDDFGGDLTNS